MKKIFSVVFAVIMLFSICSCSQTEKIPEVNPCINGDCIVEYGSTKYSCNINYLTDGIDVLTIKEPKELSGLTFRHADGKYSLSYGSLICRSNDLLLSQNSFPNTVMGILTELSKDKSKLTLKSNNGENYVFSGKSKYGEYQLTADSEGIISKISISI